MCEPKVMCVCLRMVCMCLRTIVWLHACTCETMYSSIHTIVCVLIWPCRAQVVKIWNSQTLSESIQNRLRNRSHPASPVSCISINSPFHEGALLYMVLVLERLVFAIKCIAAQFTEACSLVALTSKSTCLFTCSFKLHCMQWQHWYVKEGR